MEYLLGLHFTEEEVTTWYQDLTKTLYERFGGKPLHAYIPPHLTVIPPFDEVHLPAVKACVAEWIGRGNTGPWTVTVNGFGSFEHGVVFGKIEVSPSTQKAMQELHDAIFALLGMPQDEFPVWYPHLSVSRLPSAERLPAVWEYVQSLPAPSFTVSVPRITLFERAEGGSWKVGEVL